MENFNEEVSEITRKILNEVKIFLEDTKEDKSKMVSEVDITVIEFSQEIKDSLIIIKITHNSRVDFLT